MNRKRIIGIFAVVVLAGVACWAKSFPMTSGEGNPAASGKVEIGKDKNGNVEVTIKTEHLAKPSMLTPPATAYVVWFQERGGEPMNEGQYRVEKSLKGEFKTTTRFQSFDVFITGETDATTKFPSNQVVLRATVQGD